MIDVKIQGADEVIKTLSNLPKTTQRKAITPSMRDAMKIVKKAAESNIASIVSGEATGVLEKSLAIYSLKKFRGQYRVAVQVKRGKVNKKKLINGSPVRVGLYASVLEYGKSNQPPRSWIRKAAKENVSSVRQSVSSNIAKRLPEAIEAAK